MGKVEVMAFCRETARQLNRESLSLRICVLTNPAVPLVQLLIRSPYVQEPLSQKRHILHVPPPFRAQVQCQVQDSRTRPPGLVRSAAPQWSVREWRYTCVDAWGDRRSATGGWVGLGWVGSQGLRYSCDEGSETHRERGEEKEEREPGKQAPLSALSPLNCNMCEPHHPRP